MTYDENQISKLMKSLTISREEAIELIEEDKRIDKMSQKEVVSDLTDEQKKAVKKATGTGTKKAPTVYNFDTSKKKRAENPSKKALIDTISASLAEYGVEGLTITNPEREMTFSVGGVKYKVVLSAPRS